MLGGIVVFQLVSMVRYIVVVAEVANSTWPGIFVGVCLLSKLV